MHDQPATAAVEFAPRRPRTVLQGVGPSPGLGERRPVDGRGSTRRAASPRSLRSRTGITVLPLSPARYLIMAASLLILRPPTASAAPSRTPAPSSGTIALAPAPNRFTWPFSHSSDGVERFGPDPALSEDKDILLRPYDVYATGAGVDSAGLAHGGALRLLGRPITPLTHRTSSFHRAAACSTYRIPSDIDITRSLQPRGSQLLRMPAASAGEYANTSISVLASELFPILYIHLHADTFFKPSG